MLQHVTRFTIAVSALLATAATLAEDTVQIAVTGLYEWDRQIKPGGDWWGIFPDGKDGYTLRPTRVSAVPDPSMVIAPEKPPRQICVPGKNGDLIVFRGLMTAALGPLKSVSLADYPRPLAPGEHYDLQWDLDTPEARIRLLAAGHPVGEEAEAYVIREVDDYELWVQRGSGESSTMQLLFKESEDFGDECATLRWAGDLDRDGQLDLIYNLGRHHTETRLALYLSSAAKPGELVGLVARWNGSCGC